MWTDGVTLVLEPGEAGEAAEVEELTDSVARWLYTRLDEAVADSPAGRGFLAEGFGEDATEFVEERGRLGRVWDAWDETWSIQVAVDDDHGAGMDKMLIAGHWLRRIVDVCRAELEAWLEGQGFALKGIETETDREPRCMVADGQVLLIEPTDDGEDVVELFRGGVSIDAKDLAPADRETARELIAEGACACPLCQG